MLRQAHLVAFILALPLVLLLACHQESQPEAEKTGLPPTALMDMVEMLRNDLEAIRHPSDGGGRAWLAEGSTLEVMASQAGHWEIVFETGPEGIAEGGWIFFQVPPFWGWSTPQTAAPSSPGYTEVQTDAEGIELNVFTADQQLLAIEIIGRSLIHGEQVRIHYGSGALGANSDRYAERGSPFWIAVDGDGDGVRALISEAPRIDVVAGRPARIVLTVQSTAAPGEPVTLDMAIVDGLGSISEISDATIELDLPDFVAGPQSVALGPDDRGSRRVQLTASRDGVYRVSARTKDGIGGESNALIVGSGLPRILWGDLHGHSGFSDGTGTPEDYYRYARDVAALDVAVLTDHDHWGFPHLDQTPEMWTEIKKQAKAFHQPGRFVSLLGYEWTSWIYGHRHVLYFGDEGPLLSSMNPDYETPAMLWQGLRGLPALTFAHHSAGGPIATDWSFPPDPELEPVTEIASVHGSSEAMDSPGLIYRPIAGNFVRDTLDKGYLLGFIGSGDSHDGHPGLSHLASPTGGLAAFLDAEPTRESILETLRERRVYATNGPRIIVLAWLDEQPPGSRLAPRKEGRLRLEVIAASTLRAVEVIRSGKTAESLSADGSYLSADLRIADLEAREYLYIRVIQEDGGAAWTSPFFFAEPAILED